MNLAALSPKLTSEQRAALEDHDRTLSLAAGAGCGKTFVLTERFLSYLDPRMLDTPAELHELVAITFTDAAAREMRLRIRRRCYELYQQAQESSERAAWQRLLRCLDAARISTIHSFCGTLLRNHPVEAAVDPRFEVLDPPAAELLRLQTLDDSLRELLQASDERVLKLATRFRLQNLREYLADLMGTHLEPFMQQWRGASIEDLIGTWQDYYEGTVVPAEIAALTQSPALRTLQKMCNEPSLETPKFLDRARQVLQAIDSLAEGEASAAKDLRSLAGVQGVCTKKDWADPEQYQLYKSTCDQVRKLVEKSCLGKTLSEAGCREAAQTGLDLLHLVDHISRRYVAVKQDTNALEFDDLLTRSYRLLTDPDHVSMQRQLAASTRLLLVDEFQDTDPLQVNIVKALCGDDWSRQGLFVVGDHKQSIYRFRGAEPGVSSELRSSLKKDSRLSLTLNFRSQPGILKFVNTLFEDAFTREYEPLQPKREQVSPEPAVEFLWSGADDQQSVSPNLSPVQQARAREAKLIAHRLAQLIDSQQPLIPTDDTSGENTVLRPLKQGDVAILLRALSDVAIYEDALRQQGLDYYILGGHAFYAQQEIYDVLNLLRAVASEADELSLAGALRSPIFALNDESLYWLVRQQGSLNAGLRASNPPEQLNASEQSRVATAAATIQRLRAAKDHVLVAELLNLAMELTGYDATLLCEFMGERKLANILKLVEQARAIDQTRPGDLQGFIMQLSELVARDPKEPLATTAGQGDVIRIMTIHNSKGMEFPLVIVPDLERGTRVSSYTPVFDLQLGPLVKPVEKGDLVGYTLHQTVEREEDKEELKRLLYVACTRAADRLILSSNVDNLEKPKSDWTKLLAEKFDLQSGKPLKSASASPSQALVEVITELPPSERKLCGPPRGANLEKLIEKTGELVEQGKGTIPDTVAAISPNVASQRRFSFSQLSGQLEIEFSEATSDHSESSADLDPLRFGSLVHAVLEQVDFRATENLQQLCEFLAPIQVHPDWEAGAREAETIVRSFLESDRAKQLATAATIEREIEFLLPWPEIGEECYLHGYIDCLYRDSTGDWHLLDYKTNQGTVADVPQLAEKYALQIYVYSLACEQALGVAPVESVLYFLRPQAEADCQFDSSRQVSMRAQIAQAIKKLRTAT